MLTYTKTITVRQPRLEIFQDTDNFHPRGEDQQNLGHFITVDSKYNSPDEDETLKSIINTLGDESKDQAEHMEKIKAELFHNDYGSVLSIHPVVKYEHGGVTYSLGTKHGFDFSNNGFYIVTDKTLKEFGDLKPDEFIDRIKQELREYTQWANGEVYGATVYDEKGEEIDQFGGFYGLDDLKDSLPSEFKDEELSEYMRNED